MPSYFSMGTQSSEQTSQRYLQINNCGFCEALEKSTVSRPNGRKDYQLIYIKSGEMEFNIDGQKLHLTGGNTFFYRPGTAQHYRICGTATTFFWIHFTGTAVEDMLSPLPEGHLQTGAFEEFERYCRAFYADRQLPAQFDPLHHEGKLICLFSVLISRCTGRQKQYHKKLEPALTAMSRSLQNRYSNEYLAQLCDLSKHYFIKLFKQSTGLTPQQYYTRLVVDQGCALLENTDCSVSQIAAECGIEDTFYFSRLFKKHTGLSPAAYRKHRQR